MNDTIKFIILICSIVQSFITITQCFDYITVTRPSLKLNILAKYFFKCFNSIIEQPLFNIFILAFLTKSSAFSFCNLSANHETIVLTSISDATHQNKFHLVLHMLELLLMSAVSKDFSVFIIINIDRFITLLCVNFLCDPPLTSYYTKC